MSRYRGTALGQRREIDRKAILDVALEHPLVRLVDLVHPVTSTSDTIPRSAQKSSISWVSLIPPIVEPVSRRRRPIRLNADGAPYTVPATIDDPAILEEIAAALGGIGYPRVADGRRDTS